MIHKLNEDQQEVIDALLTQSYQRERSSSEWVERYMTFSGVSFKWLHGFGKGNDIKIFDDRQPKWFSRRVIKLLSQ